MIFFREPFFRLRFFLPFFFLESDRSFFSRCVEPDFCFSRYVVPNFFSWNHRKMLTVERPIQLKRSDQTHRITLAPNYNQHTCRFFFNNQCISLFHQSADILLIVHACSFLTSFKCFFPNNHILKL